MKLHILLSAILISCARAQDTVPDFPFPELGTLKTKSAKEIKSSSWSIGAETLDRDFASYDAYRDYLGPLGAKSVRLQAGWAKTESQTGVYNWTWLDHIIDDALAQGVKPWLQFSYGNPIYKDGGHPNIGSPLPGSEPALRAWDAWVRAAVLRYRDRIDTWEIWNEPDHKTPVPVKDYVDFYCRTAGIIRAESSHSRIFALSLAAKASYADEFLQLMTRAGKLDLIDAVTFHHYPINPDELSLLYALRQSVARTAHPIELREGESGAPSRSTTGALARHTWSELTQAKWNLRRMMAFHGEGVPYSLFTICDFLYPNGMNTKGLLEAGPDQKVIKTKMAYNAARHVFTIFDDSLTLTPGFQAKAVSSEGELAVSGYTQKDGGKSVAALWRKDAPPLDKNILNTVELVVAPADFSHPVYVDLLSGRIFDLSRENWTKEGNGIRLKGIPVYDSPILIGDRDAIEH